MERAVVFPGQGSQRPGMAEPWRTEPAFARWEEASDVLGWDVARLGVAAEADELREPRNCQVALFVHHAVLYESWAQGHRDAAGGARPAALAGHSLGEYNALVAGGLLSFAEALRLVEVRATATQRAAQANPGTMAALIAADPDTVTRRCVAAGVFLANDNAPGQIVIAGSPDGLRRLEAGLGERERLMWLEVGAAYHSPHMVPAVPALSVALEQAAFADAEIDVVANVDAAVHRDGAAWPELLRRQLVSPVRWRETVTALAERGIAEQVELGASPVLTGLAKRIAPSLSRRHVAVPSDLEVLA